jgi:hypothetical protein
MGIQLELGWSAGHSLLGELDEMNVIRTISAQGCQQRN